MRKFLLAITVAFFAIIPATTAQYADWNITDFDSIIEVQTDSSFNVTEEITVDFSRYPQHGIFRNIPISYRDKFGNPFSIRINLESITDANNKPIPYSKSNQGNDIVFKIGDADKYVNDIIQYKIKYQVNRALLDNKDWDEVYWNVNGNGWPVSIEHATATIKLPSTVDQSKIEGICFTGSYGSQDQLCTVTNNGKEIKIETDVSLSPYEGLTIGTQFPKGAITHPTTFQKALWFIQDNWPIAIPFLVFSFLYYLWYTRGRDPETRDTIVPQYHPPKDLLPTEIGTIIDERVDPKDISATILDLAIRGYLTITESEEKQLIFFNKTEYTFKLTKNYDQTIADSTLKEYEIEIIKAIFTKKNTAKLSDLTNKFYASLPKIKEKVYNDLHQKGYFPHNPDKIRNQYLYTGIAIFFGTIFFFGLIAEIFGFITAFSSLLTGLLIMGFSFIMPRKTKKGVDAYYYIKGFEEYISTAEKDRIKFFENETDTFEKILPYAMVLGVGKKWAQAFEGIYKTPPTWYHGATWHHFNTINFIDRISALDSSMNTTFTSAPRSSASSGGSSFGGGGFSGGGFGGGGGGSW